MGRIAAFNMAGHENLWGGEVVKMATLDLEHEQESGMPTMAEGWVLVPQWKESIASPCVSDN